ncbi:hypothetical protein [Mesorhizobium sp. CO1-1-8]|uniref:hypothetical protein n=1 Tax=Mesorhizobium sp. CO1-1-8 TaxID=2876631 RepID=UPI001CD08486|nr:hypothetical protein [Mesorhizobium sp. CO1-1-8]
MISLLAACATPAEKSAPCKRPADLTGYVADPGKECGAMRLVDPDSTAVLAAISGLAQKPE